MAATPVMGQARLHDSTPGYTYFHRVGADSETHDAAVRDCYRKAVGMRPDSGGSMVTGLIGAGMEAFAAYNAQAANIENCMVVKGWAVVELDEATGKALAAAPVESRRTSLAAMIGAPTPPGIVRRVFANDFTRSDTVWRDKPGLIDKRSLSLISIGRPATPLPPLEPVRPRQPGVKFPAKSLSLKAQAAQPADATLIVVRMYYGGNFGGVAELILTRLGDDGRTAEPVKDQMNLIRVAVPGTLFGPDKVFAFNAPPGRWRLTSVMGLNQELSFCLGAPTFDVAPGEAIFAGSFMFASDGQALPNLDFAPLAAKVDPALMARLKPAIYTNGSVDDCTGSYLYALEIPGAPFATGYDMGSRAPR